MDKNKMDKKGLGLMFELLCIVLVPVVFVGGFCLLSLRNVGKRTSTKVMLHELEAMEYSVESSLKLRFVYRDFNIQHKNLWSTLLSQALS